MRSWRWAPATAASVLAMVALVVAACSGSGPAAPAATEPAPADSSASAGPVPGAADWPTYHGSLRRTGVSATMPAASGTLTRVQSLRLDGAVYASPIVVRGLTIVATESDTVYAFDQSYRQVWKHNLGSPSPAEERQCGNINPLGITGTPVYDAASGHVFLVAEHGGAVRHVLYALDASSGRIAWSKSVDLPGVSARDMQQRGALAIAGGRVWVSYGAQAGDCGNYKGRVVGVPLDGGGGVVFYSPPTKRGGGIWNPNGKYDVENQGVSPDYEVELDPKAFRQGHDTQLEKAVEVLMQELEKHPAPKLKRPAYPNYQRN